MKKFLMTLLTLVLVCSMTLANTAWAEVDTTMTAEEAATKYLELKDQENAILAENAALWEKVFLAMDKDKAMISVATGENYGKFLLDTIESAKDQFTEEELTLITGEAEKIQTIEDDVEALLAAYPNAKQDAIDGNTGTMSVPADASMVVSSDSAMEVSADTAGVTVTMDDTAEKFPAFEGMDLDGNAVNSSELFAANAVTVVNFWFTTCSPCVGELSELDAMNQELAEKGGALIGINAFTLDGDADAIAEAKAVLEKKGATYQNVYFASDSEAGQFTENIFAYPTTYVVDRNGNLVGDPIVGAITAENQAKALQELIDQALAADAAK